MNRDELIRSRHRLRRRARHLRGKLQTVKRLIVRRNRQIKHASSGAQAAVKWALAQVGTHEVPAFSNAGPKISDWIRAGGGAPGLPWCQYFADAVLVHGGGAQLPSGYTVQVVEWARAGQHGLKAVHESERRPGDFVFFKFPGVSGELCDHVGVDIGGGRTVEGNTSPGTSGSQNNGGGVYIRQRPGSLVAAVVRPTYGK